MATVSVIKFMSSTFGYQLNTQFQFVEIKIIQVESFREIFKQDADTESKKVVGHHLLMVEKFDESQNFRFEIENIP